MAVSLCRSCLVFALLLFTLSSSACSEDSFEQVKAKGDVIVRALSAYERNHGTFPAKLDDLVPQYLSEIPQPNWGNDEWIYQAKTGPDAPYPYDLAVIVGEGYPVIFFISKSGEWAYDR